MKGFSGLKVWGARGSLPVSGAEFAKYGGDTTCYELHDADGNKFLVDAGSGIARAAAMPQWAERETIDIIISHLHYDHIMGLPFFTPIYTPSVKVRLWSGLYDDAASFHADLSAIFSPPSFPLPVVERDNVECRVFEPGETLELGGIAVHTLPLTHPGGCVGLSAELLGGRLAVIADHEHGIAPVDDQIARVLRDCDAFLYDATYTADEYLNREGWGHSTWQKAVDFANTSGAAPILTHHAQTRTDDEIDRILDEARARCNVVSAATEE